MSRSRIYPLLGKRAKEEQRTLREAMRQRQLRPQWEIYHGLPFTAKLRNLADRRYEESLDFPALGRNFTVGLKWRWSRE